MSEATIHQIIDRAVAMGPITLMRDMQLQRSNVVVVSPALSIDDKRTVLAAWESDLCATDFETDVSTFAGTPEPVSIDEVRLVLMELDRRYRSKRSGGHEYRSFRTTLR